MPHGRLPGNVLLGGDLGHTGLDFVSVAFERLRIPPEKPEEACVVRELWASLLSLLPLQLYPLG